MTDLVRDKLRVVGRLAALLVLLGLGTVPVECAAVYGPHSIFISAESVAQVRGGGHDHTHAPASMSAGMSTISMPDEHAPAHEPGSSDAQADSAGVNIRLPAPAGTSVDALVAVALLEAPGAPGPGEFTSISRFISSPTDNLLPAPEPPPPQRGS